MDGLVIGLALCDSYTQVNCGGQEKVWAFPTVICRKKNEDMWFVGEEAYGFTLTGEGVIVDKLLNLARKNGTATMAQSRSARWWWLCPMWTTGPWTVCCTVPTI